MDSTRLGTSDLAVSRVGLGCNNFGRRLDLARARVVIEAAIEAGITFLDTADIYGNGDSESFIGETLAGRGGHVVVATKFGNDMQGANGDAPRGSREYMRRAVDASLGRLRRDRIDLLVLPPARRRDCSRACLLRRPSAGPRRRCRVWRSGSGRGGLTR